MASVSAGMVKELREKTGAGMMDCKKALTETEGNFDKAIEHLRKKGLSKAAKKAGRAATEGNIGTYVHHNGKIGVLVEINCETDFVAKTDEFKELTKDVAMHIAAASPSYVRVDEIPEDIIDKEKEIIKAQIAKENKPENIVEKIVEGRIQKFFTENVLLHQKYVKDDTKTIEEVLTDRIGKLGENIVINRFSRMAIGEK
ncbi:MAG: translation elongation factor Ts [Candidatus Muiribacteriota bacterium]